MSANTLVINYTAPSAMEDGYWLRLQQVDLPEEIATVKDAAVVLDTLYNLDPCGESERTEITSPEAISALASPLTFADVVEAAQEVLDTPICDQLSDGSVEVKVRVIRSHVNEPYRLRVRGGSVVETVVFDDLVIRTITVQAATSCVLDYPVMSGFQAEWLGAVVAEGGGAPPINILGSTLYWQGSASGTIKARYITRVHQVSIKVHGIDGEQGQAMVRCFYHGLVEELEPVLPDAAAYDRSNCSSDTAGEVDWPDQQVTCYQDVVQIRLCSCSKEELDRRTYQQTVACPDYAPKKCPNGLATCMHNLGTVVVYEYVGCTNDGDDYSDPEFARNACCGAAPSQLPRCGVEKRSWQGGVEIDGGADAYRAAYGNQVRIVPVTPDGGICGEWTIRQEIHGGTGRPPAILGDNHLVAPEATIIIEADVYTSETTWSSDKLRLLSATRTQAIFKAPDDFCGSARVTIVDACGQGDDTTVRSTAGAWVVATHGEEWDECHCPAGDGPGVVVQYAQGTLFPERWEIVSGGYKCLNRMTHNDAFFWQNSCIGNPFCPSMMWPELLTQYCEDFETAYGYTFVDTAGHCCHNVINGQDEYLAMVQYVMMAYRWECSV